MEQFTLFSFEHLLVLGIGFIGSIIFLFLGLLLRKDNLAKFLAIIILVIKILELIYRYRYLNENIVNLLPLHLCNIALILAIFTMFFESKSLFQLLYFWGIGAIFAVITPDITLGIKNFSTISFFITHFFILFSIAFGILHFNFRISKSGALTAFIFINLIAFAVYFLNKKLGTNFLYVNRLPLGKTPLNFFGPWPYYIFSVEGIYIALSFILYLPFREKKTRYLYR